MKILAILFFSLTTLVQDPEIRNCIAQISADSISSYIEQLVGFHTRHNLSTQQLPDRGIGAAAAWLEHKVANWIPASEGRLSVEQQTYAAGGEGSRLGRSITLPNVVATLRGTQHPEKEILLLAHFDTRVDNNNDSTSFAPGANDNGSGVACLLEVLRVLSSASPLPVTIRCAFLSGEEHGLLGAQDLAKRSKAEGRQIIAVINNDMIGNTSASETQQRNNTQVRVFSNEGEAREWARYIKTTAERYVDNMSVKLIYRNDRYGRGGDHSPFTQQGYTAVRLCEYYENYNRTHQQVHTADGIAYGDIPSGVDFEYVRKNTCVNLAAIMNLALAPDDPSDVRMNTRTLSNFTFLNWKGQAPGYYVLMRETDQSTWEKALYVEGSSSGELSARLPYSKDNYFFAVSSVDNRGHESLPVCIK